MRKWKAFRKFLSVMIAALLILPGAVKIDAATTTFPVDPEDSVILNVEFTDTRSTNKHTVALALWTNGDSVYLMTDTTHNIESIKLGLEPNVISPLEYYVYAPKQQVTVGTKVYSPTNSQGNTDSSHLTIARFSLADFLRELGLNEAGEYAVTVDSEQGGGHEIEGKLTITVPKAAAVISKTWVDGPKYPATIQLYRDYADQDIQAPPSAVNAPFVLTENVNNINYRVDGLKYTDNLGRIFTYYFEEKNVPEGYIP